MDKLSFDVAAGELAKLYAAAEPVYARHLSRELFDLLHKTHELALIFKGFPREIAAAAAHAKVREITGSERPL